MDPITHSLAAAALLAVARPAPSGLDAASLACLAGSLVPDLDIVCRAWGQQAYLNHHRRFSHSLFGLAVQGGIVALLHTLVSGGFSSQVLLWYLLGGLSHVLLDSLNYYGVALFWPFSRRIFSLGLLNLLDPLLLVLLLVMSGGKWFYSWLPPVAGGLTVVYLAFRWWMRYWVGGNIRGNSPGTGFPVRVVVMPGDFGFRGWNFVLESDRKVVVGQVTCFPWSFKIHRSLEWGSLEVPAVAAAMKSRMASWFKDFSPHVFVRHRQERGCHLVELLDLRYFSQGHFLHRVTIVLDQQLNLMEEIFCSWGKEQRRRCLPAA
jgi:inner membrane protein